MGKDWERSRKVKWMDCWLGKKKDENNLQWLCMKQNETIKIGKKNFDCKTKRDG